MPRPLRESVAGGCYHVLSRGNGRARVFLAPDDYDAFVTLVGGACERHAMGVIAYCLMPDHFHLVLQPAEDGGLSSWMQWLLTAHVRRHHRRHDSSGHLWEGRYKSFPVQDDSHLLTVLRYVERNPLRAGLVPRAEDWLWSSLRWSGATGGPAWLVEGPLPRPAGWVDYVNQDATAEEEQVRLGLKRGAPFGTEAWRAATARRLGLESTLRPRGRPRKGLAEK